MSAEEVVVFVRGEIVLGAAVAAQWLTVMDFLKLGTQDLDVLRDVCVRYGKPVPRQIKMVYDAKTHGFDSKISYDSLQKENKSAGQAFMDWRSEIENRN